MEFLRTFTAVEFQHTKGEDRVAVFEDGPNCVIALADGMGGRAGGAAAAVAFGLPLYWDGIFIGTILTATSVSISAQTLLELGALRSREGSTILGAAASGAAGPVHRLEPGGATAQHPFYRIPEPVFDIALGAGALLGLPHSGPDGGASRSRR